MIREDFPPPGSPSYLDGECDGWEYRITFRAGTLQKTYDMVRAFLDEEGYDDIPLPDNAEDLKLFRQDNRKKQLVMFEDNGYVHNPIKILFPASSKFRNALTLCLFNEKEPQHLLKFHRVLPPTPENEDESAEG
jgi:hypothetical protein